MFRTRLLSGIVLVITLIALVGVGGDLLYGAVFITGLIGLTELYKVVKIERQALGCAGYLAAAGYYVLLRTDKMEHIMVMCIGLIILVMAIYVFAYPRYVAGQVTMTVFGVFYVAVMLSYVYQARMLQDGVVMVGLIFLSSWGCDTCAYCVGVLFGKHKLAPVLSPKKSVEGSIGGVAGAALLGALFALIMNRFAGADVSGILSATICGVGGIISQIGDLSASAIKRNHKIKDYGKLIPGHGGILDRFDSVIFTAPVIYYLAVLLGV